VVRDDERDLFPGFSARLVGLSAGDHTNFTLDIPDDFDATELRGRTIWVDAHVARVRSRVLPDWSDELAAKISGGEVETIDALRENTREQLQQAARNVADQKTLEGALEQLVAGATFRYPEELVQDYLSELLVEFDRSLRQQGLTLEDFKKITGQTEEHIREQYRPRAIERAERALALGKLVDEEELDVSDADIEAEIDAMSEALGGDQAGRFRQFLLSDQSRANIGNRLATNRATGRLLAIARGENPPKGPAPQDKSEDTPANVAAVETPQEAPVTKGQLEGAGDAQPGAETGASAADTPGEEAVAGLAVEQPPTDEPDDTASADE
jgi:FKBP-type peptidyl-prolyl cis-trans isomerase (trigger factor)